MTAHATQKVPFLGVRGRLSMVPAALLIAWTQVKPGGRDRHELSYSRIARSYFGDRDPASRVRSPMSEWVSRLIRFLQQRIFLDALRQQACPRANLIHAGGLIVPNPFAALAVIDTDRLAGSGIQEAVGEPAGARVADRAARPARRCLARRCLAGRHFLVDGRAANHWLRIIADRKPRIHVMGYKARANRRNVASVSFGD